MVSLSSDQKSALDSLMSWQKGKNISRNFITVGGYAGTGKSTLVAHLRKELKTLKPNLKVGFASYTGKAARVLRSKLNEQNILQEKDTVGTIHSLIYSPIVNDDEEIVGWQRKEKLDKDLIIIDEASMVDQVIWQHLLSYQIPIIAVGDHGQLPPIEGKFNLMKEPDLMLNKIHRQAENNPIIGLSIQAREYGLIKFGEYSSTVRKFDMSEYDAQEAQQELLGNYKNDTLVLCGFNATRNRLNTYIRSSLGFESTSPTSSDRVICLRNNHKIGIANGMLGTINKINKRGEDWYEAEIVMDDEEDVYKGLISAKQFGAKTAFNFTEKRGEFMMGDLFDFGYALTVHKAQGSQAKKVVLLEERSPKMDDEQWRRWLYTAVTRAEQELYIFGRNNSLLE
ncbi:MAG: AAA family ATPase [Patescibacteria group bacterium]